MWNVLPCTISRNYDPFSVPSGKKSTYTMTGGGSAMDRPKIPLLAKVKILEIPKTPNFPIGKLLMFFKLVA